MKKGKFDIFKKIWGEGLIVGVYDRREMLRSQPLTHFFNTLNHN